MFDQVLGERIGFFEAIGKGVICQIAKSVIKYGAIRRLLTALHCYSYITIEQERDPRNADGRFGDVQESRDYLTSIVF